MSKQYLTNAQIKQELKKMMVIVDRYLTEHDLNYTVYGGTLLGAVRHKGFIPWDDDIDLGMLRPEYDRLIHLLNSSELENPLKGIGYELGEGDWPFLKIINRDIYVDENNTEISPNLWIDIFPVDAAPNHFSRAYFLYLYYFLRRLYFCKRAEVVHLKMDGKKNVFKASYNNLVSFIAKQISTEKVIQHYISVCKKFSVDKAKRYSENVWGSWQFPRNLFNQYKEYDFEDIKVKGIVEADAYLRILYGDYMELPPEDERTGHGIIAWRNIIDEE